MSEQVKIAWLTLSGRRSLSEQARQRLMEILGGCYSEVEEFLHISAIRNLDGSLRFATGEDVMTIEETKADLATRVPQLFEEIDGELVRQGISVDGLNHDDWSAINTRFISYQRSDDPAKIIDDFVADIEALKFI